MSVFEREMRNAVEIIPNRLYYVALSNPPTSSVTTPQKQHFFSIDNEMIYWNFYLDFGPLNMGHVYRYCQMMNQKLKDPKHAEKAIYHFSHTHAHKRTNAVFLICAWSLLYQNKTPEEAFKPFKNYPYPFPFWHDATPSVCTFELSILDTLKGLHKAREHNFFSLQDFDIEEYEYYEQVEHGDLNWYVNNKFLGFAGPHAERTFCAGGYYTLRPDDYIRYFKKRNVSLVVRLNKPYYDAKKFTSQGIDHMELYFLDGSNPTDAILNKFITRCEETNGAIAVHCKAGLGRTGTCIAAYIMKHYKLTAEEIIGWMRIVRPGSIIGPQQHYVREIQAKMWRDGDLMRTKLTSLAPPMSPMAPTAPHTSAPNSVANRLNKLSISTSNSMASASSGSNASTPTNASRSGQTATPPISRSGTPRSATTANAVLRPSSRSHSRPSTAQSNELPQISGKDNETEKDSQGDFLRMRRQQHLQNTAIYSLSSSSPATSSGTGAIPRPSSSSVQTRLFSNDPNSSSQHTETDSSQRPKSRIGSFLSSFK